MFMFYKVDIIGEYIHTKSVNFRSLQFDDLRSSTTYNTSNLRTENSRW